MGAPYIYDISRLRVKWGLPELHGLYYEMLSRALYFGRLQALVVTVDVH